MRNKTSPLTQAVAILICWLLAFPAQAANFFMTPAGAGAKNGSDWNNAFDEATLEAGWLSVTPGSTVWVAGGNYAYSLEVRTNGTSSARTWMKRAHAGATEATSAAGWNSSFDSQIVWGSESVYNPIYVSKANCANYFGFDGGPMIGTNKGWKFLIPPNAGGNYPAQMHWWGAANSDNVIITGMDLKGPWDGTEEITEGLDATVNAITIHKASGTGYMKNFIISNNWMHGFINTVTIIGNSIQAADDIIFIDNDFYNGVANNPTHHANMFEIRDVGDIAWINNEMHTWIVEGIMTYGATYGNIYILGNVFRHPITPLAAPAVGRCFEVHDSAWKYYVFNNTFVEINGAGIYNVDDGTYHADSEARNNIYYSSGMGEVGFPDFDYDWTTSSSVSGANSIANGTDPFINRAGLDYRIIETTGPAWPRGNGTPVTLPEPYATYWATDRNGTTRDPVNPSIGAFEYTDGGEEPPPPTPPTITDEPDSQSIASGATATMSVSATGTATLTYQWYEGTSGNTGTPISGATSSSYTTPALTATTQYWVRVTNSAGSDDSTTATITVTSEGGTSGGGGGTGTANVGTANIGTVNTP